MHSGQAITCCRIQIGSIGKQPCDSIGVTDAGRLDKIGCETPNGKAERATNYQTQQSV
jgi:hypothetical protein